MLSGRTFFWNPDKCGHCGFQVKCVVKCMSRCVELSLRSVDGLGGDAKVSTRDRKAGCSTRIYFIPWEWWQSEERSQQVVCYRVEDGIGDWGNGGKGMICSQSICCPGWSQSVAVVYLFVFLSLSEEM